MSVLRVENVSKQFGGLLAVDAVSFELRRGERRAILGPNGAGKTTLFNMLGGQLLPSSGCIELFGTDVTQMAPYRRADLGLARTFQTTNLFPNLSVEENVILTLQVGERLRLAMHRPARSYGRIRLRLAEVLEQWSLQEHRNTHVRYLSYGEQRRLEIALALATGPRLLLLDEPTAGLSLEETRMVESLIAGLDRDVSVVLIEHDMDVAFEVADWFMVLHNGQVIADGPPDVVRNDPRVREIYLGADLAEVRQDPTGPDG